jgi:monooxygenase
MDAASTPERPGRPRSVRRAAGSSCRVRAGRGTMTVAMPSGPAHVDVLIVGAGLSGIGAAHHLQARCPHKTYLILEGRERLGGTWDLFRYPGVRSDSDMYTLGYSFRPWTSPHAIADGDSILTYIRQTAEAAGIERKIRYQHRVERARWSTADARWTITARDLATGQELAITCAFLYVCAGYYDYEAGYTPAFPGRERFRGRVVHPQHWTPDIDYRGRVVVIGSGATAVTLVPALAERAAHVTMLQRSPT